MLNVRSLSILAATGLICSLPTALLADGASIAKEKCFACHEESGNSSDEKVPNIAGFSVDTLKEIMEDFREGERPASKYKPKDGEETDMQEVAKGLNEDDTAAVAEYYAKQTFKKQPNVTDPAKVAKGRKLHNKNCEKCHSEGGSNSEDDAAILSGQWMAYLKKEFDDIASGKREAPKKMMKKFKKLDKDDYEALIHYYGAGEE